MSWQFKLADCCRARAERTAVWPRTENTARLLHSLNMRVKILGSAAGGGFPQWNCGCSNCRSVRAGNFHGKPRSQAEVALSADGASWFLLGASPDLRAQIEAASELHPQQG